MIATFRRVDVGVLGSVPQARLGRGVLRAMATPRVILAPPQSQTAFAGADVSFSVQASGLAPLTYRWFGPAGAISSATTSVLMLPSVDVSDSGDYFVKVGNQFGTTPSSNAALTVVRADFGDAPAPYPTLLASNGAVHLIVPG